MLDRELFDFLELTPDAAFAVTDGGEICSWNSSVEVLFGLSRVRLRQTCGCEVQTHYCQVPRMSRKTRA